MLVLGSAGHLILPRAMLRSDDTDARWTALRVDTYGGGRPGGQYLKRSGGPVPRAAEQWHCGGPGPPRKPYTVNHSWRGHFGAGRCLDAERAIQRRELLPSCAYCAAQSLARFFQAKGAMMNKLRSPLSGILLGVGVLLVAWGHGPAAAQGDAKQVAQKWEYQSISGENVGRFNELGADGWELCAAVGRTQTSAESFIFKRPKR
jgi:hypothetical protein